MILDLEKGATHYVYDLILENYESMPQTTLCFLTLAYQINVGLRLLNLELHSQGYALIS